MDVTEDDWAAWADESLDWARHTLAAGAEVWDREYVSALWAEDWDSPEDAAYDDQG